MLTSRIILSLSLLLPSLVRAEITEEIIGKMRENWRAQVVREESALDAHRDKVARDFVKFHGQAVGQMEATRKAKVNPKSAKDLSSGATEEFRSLKEKNLAITKIAADVQNWDKAMEAAKTDITAAVKLLDKISPSPIKSEAEAILELYFSRVSFLEMVKRGQISGNLFKMKAGDAFIMRGVRTEVTQVIGPQSMLVTASYGPESVTFFVEGVPTKDLADDAPIELPNLVATGTRAYITAREIQRTAFVLEPITKEVIKKVIEKP